MSLGLVFKGPEGIVLSADSRVTLQFTQPSSQPNVLLSSPAYYDNATKLLKVAGQNYVGAVTVGLGAIGVSTPRTAHSFIPELDKELDKQKRLPVFDFATRISEFYVRQWRQLMPATGQFDDMIFLVGGYNENETHGRVYALAIPSNPVPIELNQNDFGLTFQGQTEITARLLNAIDVPVLLHLQKMFNIKDQELASTVQEIKSNFGLKIPYQFISLQDAVDLSMLLITTTSQLQKYITGVRGVGGPIDMATITGVEGFHYVQHKEIHGVGR
jgi:hypothetical protein